MNNRTKIIKPLKADKAEMIEQIFSEIEKDIAQDLSFFQNNKFDFYKVIQQIIIQEKVYRDPTTKSNDIIKKLDLNRNDFFKNFQSCFGMSYKEFVSLLRLKEAMILLEQSDLSIEKISTKVGFGTIRTFQRQFQSKYNMSPKTYRNSNKTLMV